MSGMEGKDRTKNYWGWKLDPFFSGLPFRVFLVLNSVNTGGEPLQVHKTASLMTALYWSPAKRAKTTSMWLVFHNTFIVFHLRDYPLFRDWGLKGLSFRK